MTPGFFLRLAERLKEAGDREVSDADENSYDAAYTVRAALHRIADCIRDEVENSK